MMTELETPEPVGVRTPIVRIEIQPSPPVPLDAVPYWWGYNMLKFYPPGKPLEKIWEREIVELRQFEKATARCEKDARFGWLIVIEISHDEARKALGLIGFPPTMVEAQGTAGRAS